jgi:polyhydroxybutyrate depolymerase
VPYFGGHVGTPNGLPVAAAEKTAAAWAHHNGCAPVATRAHLSTQVTRLTWQQCTAPVVMYRIEGGGHTWPGAAIHVDRLGLTTDQINATEEMWRFFEAN